MAEYDAIVVGARCAGSPLAMVLARKGYKVLVVDKATFPSDTISTHVVHPVAIDALRRWGLLDTLTATGCPPIHSYRFDFGPVVIEGSPGTDDSPVAYCPRRTVLDKLLVDAAAEAGAEIREGFTVEQVLIEDGRVVGIKGRSQASGTITERAQVVVGADGRHSLVAEATSECRPSAPTTTWARSVMVPEACERPLMPTTRPSSIRTCSTVKPSRISAPASAAASTSSLSKTVRRGQYATGLS